MSNYMELYMEMCWQCEHAVKCHEECTECDEFLEAVEELEHERR